MSTISPLIFLLSAYNIRSIKNGLGRKHFAPEPLEFLRLNHCGVHGGVHCAVHNLNHCGDHRRCPRSVSTVVSTRGLSGWCPLFSGTPFSYCFATKGLVDTVSLEVLAIPPPGGSEKNPGALPGGNGAHRPTPYGLLCSFKARYSNFHKIIKLYRGGARIPGSSAPWDPTGWGSMRANLARRLESDRWLKTVRWLKAACRRQ